MAFFIPSKEAFKGDVIIYITSNLTKEFIMSVFLASLVVTAIAQLVVLIHLGEKVNKQKQENVNLRIHNLELYRKTMEQSIQITTLNMQIEIKAAQLTYADLDLKIHQVQISSLKEDLSRVSEAIRSSVTSVPMN